MQWPAENTFGLNITTIVRKGSIEGNPFDGGAMYKMYSCYCLFCETLKCKKVAFLLEKSGIDHAFSPQIIKRQRKQGKNIDLMFDLIPGYVFAFTCSPLKDAAILRVDGVIKLLGVPEYGYCLDGEDHAFALELLKRNGIVDVIKAIRIGDTVKLVDDLFYGCEAEIVQIDYRKQRAKVVYSFAGLFCSSWVACDVIDSVDILG